jgi:hypothetical protein
MKKVLFSNAAILLLIAAVYAADDVAAMKEGLWSIHFISNQTPEAEPVEGTSSLCRNHAYDTRVPPNANEAKDCNTLGSTDAASADPFQTSLRATPNARLHFHWQTFPQVIGYRPPPLTVPTFANSRRRPRVDIPASNRALMPLCAKNPPCWSKGV